MVIFLLVLVGCIFTAPIVRESMNFELLDCRIGENGTSSYHILQTKDHNETCIQINQTTSNGNQIFYYTFPSNQIENEIRIETIDCSLPTPDFHLIPCEENNSTDEFVTFYPSNFTWYHFEQSNSTYSEEIIFETIDNSDRTTKASSSEDDTD